VCWESGQWRDVGARPSSKGLGPGRGKEGKTGESSSLRNTSRPQCAWASAAQHQPAGTEDSARSLNWQGDLETGKHMSLSTHSPVSLRKQGAILHSRDPLYII
jgi:hypothetical protein